TPTPARRGADRGAPAASDHPRPGRPNFRKATFMKPRFMKVAFLKSRRVQVVVDEPVDHAERAEAESLRGGGPLAEGGRVGLGDGGGQAHSDSHRTPPSCEASRMPAVRPPGRERIGQPPR